MTWYVNNFNFFYSLNLEIINNFRENKKENILLKLEIINNGVFYFILEGDNIWLMDGWFKVQTSTYKENRHLCMWKMVQHMGNIDIHTFCACEKHVL